MVKRDQEYLSCTQINEEKVRGEIAIISYQSWARYFN